MNKRVYWLVAVSALGVAGIAIGQGRIMDMVANKVITKYQTATCEQLWVQKGQPKSQEEQRAVEFLRNDAQARTAFLNKVAAPIANKMFECGMIP
jgi:tellurite resistance protein